MQPVYTKDRLPPEPLPNPRFKKAFCANPALIGNHSPGVTGDKLQQLFFVTPPYLTLKKSGLTLTGTPSSMS